MKKSTKVKIIGGLSALYIAAYVISKKRTENKSIDDGNSYLNLAEHYKKRLEIPSRYETLVKPLLDKVLSFISFLILWPLLGAIALAVYLDDPGSIFFTQKRVGKDGRFFMLHKYRSMKMSTPHDVPTHELSDPMQYITRVGAFLRRTSLDELPQIWDIFRGKMSFIGPRPALWNQYDLVVEREKYGANSVLPGLTGLAQIKGRDELLISDKAKFDGKYSRILRKGGFDAFFFDLQVFAGTIRSVLRHDGIIEGGTGNISVLNNDQKKRASVATEMAIVKEKKIFNISEELKVHNIEYNDGLKFSPVTAEAAKNYKENKSADIKGKCILLISLPGYRDGIVAKMRELGAEVDLINDKPNDGFICKALGRYKVKFYEQVINNYYKSQLEPLKEQNYDYILTICGEYTPIETLKLLKLYYPKSRLILYMWDGLGKLNTKGIEEKWQYYDQVYTFDRIDYEAHKDKLSFLPLYYYEDYLPENKKESNSKDFVYDLSFIGTGHEDRIRIVKDVINQYEQRGMNCFSYFFIPHRLVFLYNKIFNPDFKDVRVSDVQFSKISFEKLYKIYNETRCVIDVESRGQHGLTMRSIELLGLRRKFITTNADIRNYDFYNENNIFILDREHPVVDFSFLEKPYEVLDESIYKKYSLKNWILEVLK